MEEMALCCIFEFDDGTSTIATVLCGWYYLGGNSSLAWWK
jgi:hypothetical protein